MRILYISYNGLAEPLGSSQVLPYLRSLAEHGYSFSIISFEKAGGPAMLSHAAVLRLLPRAATWTPLRYHRKPTVPATAWDITHGIARGMAMGGFDLIHARGTVPALMASVLGRARRTPWLFDVRGLMAQEYVDGGHWPVDGWLARLAGATERGLIARADGLVFLTRRMAAAAHSQYQLPLSRPVAVVPCAVDLKRFSPRDAARRRIRAELGVADTPLMVYSGSLGSWYLPDAMLDFHEIASRLMPELAFLVLTPQPEIMEGLVSRRSAANVSVRAVGPDQVPDYLSAADFGISFIDPAPSKAASSPTKLAEYLACGLPVVVNAGVGDVDELAHEPEWVVASSLDADSLGDAARQIAATLRQPDVKERARALAAKAFALEDAARQYAELYTMLARTVARC